MKAPDSILSVIILVTHAHSVPAKRERGIILIQNIGHVYAFTKRHNLD